ncbi:MAG: aminopeptidase P family protein [Clostridiales bacterium]|nr:aminopeptidase P family protein [Clostridiales bacterium]
MFSLDEKRRRFGAADEMMKREDLRALLIVGNGAVGVRAYGCYRYFVDNRVYYHMQAMIALPGQEPTVCCSTQTHLKALNSRNYTDVRVLGDDILSGVISVLKEKGVTEGRLGVSFEMLPAGWYQMIKRELPNLEMVDVTERIFEIRATRSAEEVELYRRCAEIADAGYSAVCKAAKPGVYEHELGAILDYEMKRNGAEETFTLLSSGRFSLENNGLDCLHFSAAPSRKIQEGDSIAFEITPRYQGYWTQMVRTISIGEPSEDFVTFHKLARDTIEETRRLLKPNVLLRDVIKFMMDYISAAGYVPTLPCGHICAVDLNEGRVDPESDVVLKNGMAVILHPTIVTPEISTSIFWGETYLVTPDGGECLMKSSKDLLVL